MKDTNKQAIDHLLKRGVSEIFPNSGFVESLLQGDKKISLYMGIDPTGPTLHIGHAIQLMKLREFQNLGHKIILLIGDFTGMIGDPTDKTEARNKLTAEEVLENSKLYKAQAETFLAFDGENPAKIKYNSEWLGKMNFADVLELASHMTVDQMLKRDMFDKRMEAGKPIFIHEFLYPLLQGYDSVAMDVDGEIGGNDQLFNMLAGRTLMKQLKDKEKFVLTLKLLEDPNGRKMGKSEGNMITLQDSPVDMFGKIMSWTDGMILLGFELCTYKTKEEINAFKEALDRGDNPRDIKVALAKSVVAIYHSEEEADKAEENFVNTFKEGGISLDTKEAVVSSGTILSEVLVKEKLVESKNELRRLVESGAVTNMTLNNKIESIDHVINENTDIKVGKRRFIKIEVQ